MIAPRIHLNGTPGATLIEQNRAAQLAIRTAISVLQEARPHGRDYYVQHPGVMEIAQREHRYRVERLRGVLAELETLGHDLRAQSKRESSTNSEPEPCPDCKRPDDAVNHVTGHVFVGWGIGWQLCTTCNGSGVKNLR
ncbi:MAG: hypothetical protein ABI837_13615 [Acidobacteriota bacterium]